MRPGDLVGAIANESDLTGRDIGPINIADNFSTVDVPAAAADAVIAAIKQTTIKGNAPPSAATATSADSTDGAGSEAGFRARCGRDLAGERAIRARGCEHGWRERAVAERATSGREAVAWPSRSRPVLVVAALLGLMWAVEIVDLVPGTPFDSWGIRPRSVRGLAGIPLAPFLHSGFPHLFANTLPFLVLGAAIAIGDLKRFLQVTRRSSP